MRMFVALVPPDDVRDHLDEFLAVRREAARLRWTQADQVHVTLAFCAEVPDRCLDDFAERLTRAARKRTPMTTRIAGGGAFPNPAKARVLYAGLDLEPSVSTELTRLATGARAAAAKAGIEVDGQRFRPHLTVARMGHPIEASNWVRLLDAYRGPQWRVDRVALVASYLGEGPRNRPRYETAATFGLGPAEPRFVIPG
jgi:RNA 2',3'-cyclic 3'-phosphodiesterase